ncbi:MAG: hypothetical protein LRY69_05125 [Gammaproteobacteria bacterium]|nr:hypothetical protein [Gammaproteobacteria bacterium]
MQPKNSYITDTSSINEIQASPTEFLEYNDTRFKRLNNQHWLHYRFLADWFSSRSAMVLYYPVYLFSKGKSIEYKIQRVNQLPKQSECKKNTAYYTMENSTIKIMSSELSKPRSYQEYLDPDNELEENNKNAEQEIGQSKK